MTTETELRLKHLDDVGAVIGRLSQNSFVVRGWSVTLASVVFAIISTRADHSQGLALVALVPTMIFWGMDAYYLREERLFRQLYRAVAGQLTGRAKGTVDLFDMDNTRYAAAVPSLLRTLFSVHVLAIPAMLTMLIIAYGLLS